MKVELIKQRFNDFRSYKHMPIHYCCDRLKNNSVINLSDEYSEEDSLKDEDGCVPQMMIHETEIIHSWEDEWEQDYYYPIHYCPFCGAPISIEIIGIEDKTEYYKKLCEKRDQIWSLCQKTDSKKKEIELREEARKIDKLINELHRFGEYKKEQSD